MIDQDLWTALVVLAPAGAALAAGHRWWLRWRWQRHTAEALALANEQPEREPSAFWVCPFCRRQEQTNNPRYGLSAHIRYWHSLEPRGPEDAA